VGVEVEGDGGVGKERLAVGGAGIERPGDRRPGRRGTGGTEGGGVHQVVAADMVGGVVSRVTVDAVGDHVAVGVHRIAEVDAEAGVVVDRIALDAYRRAEGGRVGRVAGDPHPGPLVEGDRVAGARCGTPDGGAFRVDGRIGEGDANAIGYGLR